MNLASVLMDAYARGYVVTADGSTVTIKTTGGLLVDVLTVPPAGALTGSERKRSLLPRVYS